MIYKGNKKVHLYYGDYKPAKLYKKEEKDTLNHQKPSNRRFLLNGISFRPCILACSSWILTCQLVCPANSVYMLVI